MKFFVLVLTGAFAIGCTTPGEKTGYGAGIGAAVGAGVGALMNGKNRGKGAVIGGVAGGLLGGSVGNYLDKQKEELDKIAETRRTERGLVTKLKGDINFEVGKSGLKQSARSRVSKIASIIARYPQDRLRIIGHTDSTGSLAFNRRLSRERAQAVASVMIARGVPRSSITTTGVGPSQPVSTNATVTGRAKNRRVDIEISVPQ